MKARKVKLSPREVVLCALADAGYLSESEMFDDEEISSWRRNGGEPPARLARLLDIPSAAQRLRIA